MSRQLLLDLNGNRRGNFYRWISNFSGEPRIAWYPSAGEDFRDLLYLHPDLPKYIPASKADPLPPDIFLHSDYFPWQTSTFLDSPRLHCDSRTLVLLKSIEELPRCDLPLDKEVVHFPDGSVATGRVLFLEIQVTSNILGKFIAPVVYVFAENAAFCSERLLPNNAKFSHIIHIRYGGGLGGGSSSGAWILNILGRTNCECFITDNHHQIQRGDRHIFSIYPELSYRDDNVNFESIRIVPSASWSGHGDVFWNLCR
jgi:hypothetical protein